MLKRYSIVALLMLAYSVVLGHSIIPHHHHDDDYAMEQSTEHHDDDHHDDDDHEDSGLAHDFANYIHSGNTGDLHQQPDIKISLNTIATAYIVVLFDFRIKAVESPPPVARHHNDHIPLLRHSLSSKGLRAPPCCIG